MSKGKPAANSEIGGFYGFTFHQEAVNSGMLKPWLLVLLVCCCHWLVAQNPGTDSLTNLLKTAKEDTNKVHLYWKTGASIIYQDPQASIPFFKKGAELAVRLNFISGIERCNNAISTAFSLNAKYDSALVYVNYAVPYAVKAGNIRRLALAYLNRADIHKNLQNYGPALKDCDTAIKYAEQINNSDGLGRIYAIIGMIYADQQQYPAAFANTDRSIQFFEKINNRRMVAQSNSNKADLFIKLKQPEKALPLLNFAIRIGDSLQDIENLAAYYSSTAESYVLLKRYDEAKIAAMKSISFTEQTGNTLQQATVYEILYHIEAEKNNMPAAIEYCLRAYATFKQEADVLRQLSAVDNLADAYAKIKDYTQAYNYQKISHDLNDSLLRQQFNTETARLQTTFNVTQKDKEIQLLNKEKELQSQRLQKQRLLMLGGVVMIVLALTGILLLMNRNKLRQRMKELVLRNRIAADLHDEVGSSLSSIHMLGQMATQTNETTRKDLLSRMSINAKETMDKMGDIVWMIKPGDTEAASLKQRMERFAWEIGTSKNMEISVELEQLEKTKLTMEQRKNIYLVFKEALNNAAKYSGANRIEIEVSLQNKELVLLVKDEGKGFNSHEVKKGNGLDNMMNRARELGAELKIQSAVNEGTTVNLVVPV